MNRTALHGLVTRASFATLFAIGCGGRTDTGLEDGLGKPRHELGTGGETGTGGAASAVGGALGSGGATSAGGLATGGLAPGGQGGSPGSGGVPACGPDRCPSVLVASAGLPLPGCCLPDGACGVTTDPLSGVLAIQGGCQRYDQPGRFDEQCPAVPLPRNQALEGCCRPDGTCGNDLSGLGLGCVQGTTGAGGQPGVNKCNANGPAPMLGSGGHSTP